MVVMIVSFLREGGLWLLQAAHGDTVLVRAVGQNTSLFEKVSSVLNMLTSLAILALAIGFVPAARHFRKTYAKIDTLMKRVNEEITPVLRQSATVVRNIEHITTSIRGDVDLVKTSVALAHEKLLDAVELAEQRLNDFNALLEVAQDEAESVFVATASTVRGVRTGAASLHHGDEEELDDGHDHSDQSEAGTARPRVRKHRRHGGA